MVFRARHKKKRHQEATCHCHPWEVCKWKEQYLDQQVQTCDPIFRTSGGNCSKLCPWWSCMNSRLKKQLSRVTIRLDCSKCALIRFSHQLSVCPYRVFTLATSSLLCVLLHFGSHKHTSVTSRFKFFGIQFNPRTPLSVTATVFSRWAQITPQSHEEMECQFHRLPMNTPHSWQSTVHAERSQPEWQATLFYNSDIRLCRRAEVLI